MDPKEMRIKAKQLNDEAMAITKKAEEEKRALTEDEQKDIDDKISEIRNLIEQAERIEKIEKNDKFFKSTEGEPQVLDPNIGMDTKEVRRYSLINAIRAAASRDWREAGLEKEASEAVAKKLGKEPRSFFVPYDWLASESRDLVVGTDASGGYTKATDLLAQNFIDLLRNKLVVQAAGATVLSGLVGDIAIPRQSGGATAYWVAESGTLTESTQAFEQVAMAPKTVGAFTDISRKLLLQSSIDIEAFVRNDLATVLALAIDYAALHGSGSSNQPTGVQNQTGVATVSIDVNGGDPAWSHIVDLETEVAQDNADVGALSYVTNAKVRGKLKQTMRVATYGDIPIWEVAAGANPLNGYPVYVSNQVRSDLTKGTGSDLSAIFFGNWRDLLIGTWGTLDVLVDPYTSSTSGTVRVVAFQDVDIAVRHGESFSMIVDAVTS